MTLLTLLLAASLQTQAATPDQTPKIAFDGSVFKVRGLGREETVSLSSPPVSDKVSYRKDDSFAVWDSRGLSIRHGSFVYSTRLPEVAVTPKLFSKEEILANRALMDKGERSQDASALSGSRRIGEEVYFLVRWDDKGGKPWLEALVKINLSSAKPKPELLGKFEGMTVAKGKVGDQLMLVGASPAAFVTNATGAWGISSFDRSNGEFSFRPLGAALMDAVALSPRLAIVTERTDYGKVRVARVDLVSGARRDLSELDGPAIFIDTEMPPMAIVPTNLGPALNNLDTGAELLLPDKPMVKRTAAGMLVWSTGKPSACVLYSPERFVKLAVAAPDKVEKPAVRDQSKPTKRIPPTD